MRISVRKARPGDFEGIVHNWENLADFFVPFDKQYHGCKPDRAKRYRKFLKKQMRSEKSAVLVAEVGGELAGI